MTWAFGNMLRPFGYRVVYLDPPWPFETYTDKGQGRSPGQHYETMSLDEIAALPVGDLLQGDGAIFMWVTRELKYDAVPLLKKAWGMHTVTTAFVWRKLSAKTGSKKYISLGHTTRAQTEECVVMKCGKLGWPNDRGVPEVIEARVREHSRKPDRIYKRIERLYGGPYCELFARTKRPGWDSWGDQLGIFEPDYQPQEKGNPQCLLTTNQKSDPTLLTLMSGAASAPAEKC